MEDDRRFEFRENSRVDNADAHRAVRASVTDADATFRTVCPAGRELSIARTKLEEALFWANAAIARGGS
ncbi:hypothetical protein [Streptomyces sp. SM12]|uniref:Acb2/Tad1 domain-containing protein n=1 Tax=Streptomyces sp. SM12 TaxID=1071602 RepID=UPI000CD4A809|nr:hypothetical protein [Streptomyces sp. SM12]